MAWWPKLRHRRAMSLALQGGGAHGAYTWGVLDALLERGVDVAAASGASAGAMNAIALTQGWLDGGRDGARAALARFWTAVGQHMPPGWFNGGEPPSLTPAARLLIEWTRVLSPYQLNPLGINPLRDILREQIDFERLRASRRGPQLFVAATHANTGRLRVFHRTEMSLETALASSCLPTLQQAVLIDGEPYWDGGYAANPALFPLVREVAADDLMIVMLSPLVHAQLPLTASEIQQRAIEIAFNATFLREVRMLSELQAQLLGSWPLGRLERRLARLRFHLIEADGALSAMPGETRLVAHLPFLERLRELGRASGLQWWQQHGTRIGRSSSADLLSLFACPRQAAQRAA
jgi:NTE family protein